MDDDSRNVHPALRGLKTVCRCNNVKYKTIERAIRDGAHTLSQVAARTTATTGHCGGSCTPLIQEMLAEHAPKEKTMPPPSANAAKPEQWWLRKK